MLTLSEELECSTSFSLERKFQGTIERSWEREFQRTKVPVRSRERKYVGTKVSVTHQNFPAGKVADTNHD